MQYIKYLKMEFKRAISVLPKALLKSVLVIAVFFTIFSVCLLYVSKDSKQDTPKLNIGYSAADNKITDMAVMYVNNVKSVKELGTFEKYSLEEGMQYLKDGKLDVMVELPDNIVNEIQSGTNTPAKVYMNDKGTIKNIFFKELANAALGMLSTAQAEIYAVSHILGESVYEDRNSIYKIWNDIDNFNINLTLNRYNIFKNEKLSITNNDSKTIYYLSAVIALYTIIIGIFFEPFFTHINSWRIMSEKKLNISRNKQFICEFLTGTFLISIPIIIQLIILWILNIFKVLSISFSLYIRDILLILSVSAICSLYFIIIYLIIGRNRNTVLVIGLLALIQGYMSGLFVPSIFIPDLIYNIGKHLPSYYIKEAFRIIITDKSDRFIIIMTGILIWSIQLLLIGLVLINKPEKIICGVKCSTTSLNYKLSIGNILPIVFKRLMFKKGILASLLFMIIASVCITCIESKSDNTFNVAVYDASGEYKDLLSNSGSFVNFKIYDSETDVKKAVLKDEAECGYILPETLTADIIWDNAKHSITVYEDSDSMCIPLVDEIIFNIIFRYSSLECYKSYMKTLGASLDKVEQMFTDQLDNTFSINLTVYNKQGDIKKEDEQSVVFSVEDVVFISVILCGIQGIIIAISDYVKGRYSKKTRFKICLEIVIIPVIVSIILGNILCIII